MKCSYHPDIDAICACINCGRLICSECREFVNDLTYCHQCSLKFKKITKKSSKPNNLESQDESPKNLLYKPNWFQKHLNWTFIFTLAISYGLVFGGSLLVYAILSVSDPYISEETQSNAGILVILVIAILFLLPISAWILEQKGRSLWNLFLLIILIGTIIFLCLENRRTGNLETDTGTDIFLEKTRIRGKWVIIVAATISGIIIIGLGVIFAIAALIPDEPSHYTSWEEVESNQMYWNTSWGGLEEELQGKVYDITDYYYKTHTYIENETDCNDMAIDIWNMLHTEGIKSVIVVGNLYLNEEQFNECDHAWLLIFNNEGHSFALEPTEGVLYFGEDVEHDPQTSQYWEGFLYIKPSDLKADIQWRW